MSKKDIIYKLLYLLSAVQIFLLFALKSKYCGADTHNIAGDFAFLSYCSQAQFWQYDLDIGVKLLCKAVSYFTNDEQVFFGVIAVVTVLPLSVMLFHDSDEPLMSLIFWIGLHFFEVCLVAQRQFVAIVLVYAAARQIKKNRLIPFLLLVAAASCFHITAVIFFAAYPLSRFKFTFREGMLFLASSVVLFFASNTLLNYFISNYFSVYEISEQTLGFWTIMFLLIAVICFIQRPFLEEENTKYIWPAAFGSILMIFSAKVGTAMRLAYYFTILYVVLLPAIIGKIENTYLRSVIKLAAIALCICFYIMFLRNNGTNLVPYVPYWEA